MLDHLAERLFDYPGIVLTLDDHDGIVAVNEAGRSRLGEVRSLPLALDPASREKWLRLTAAQTRGLTAELLLAEDAGLRSFFISPLENGTRYVIELPGDPARERLHDELTHLNSESITAQRSLARQRADLQRALAEKDRLSAELQAHGEELEAQNEELLALMEALRAQQEESERLNARLEERAQELRHVLRARERFFSAMSHELRTPLTGILGYGHLLLDGIAGDLSEQQREFIERMRAAAQHLNSVLDDILDLAKLESGTLELTLEQTMIPELVHEVVATVRPAADAAGCTLLVRIDQAPAFITTDARALRQILLNLMSNAIKFGPHQPVTLTCTRDGGQVRFEVADRGIGIEAGDADRIFEEFGQGEAGRRQKGTGLGLAISRQLAERLGGSLELKPAADAGAVFVLDLPVTGPSDP